LTRRLALSAFFVAALLVPAGCGRTGSETTVSGKVTLGDQPVAGVVTFVDSSNKEVASSPIGADGTYRVEKIPTGQYKVVVKAGLGAAPPIAGQPPTPKDAKPIEMKDMGSMPGAQKTASPPKKYQTASTSDLSFEVKSGKNTYDIALKE